jgi:hypothetical protein
MNFLYEIRMRLEFALYVMFGKLVVGLVSLFLYILLFSFGLPLILVFLFG